MKLIYCPNCHDVVKMADSLSARPNTCDCGQSWGEYTDNGLNAVYGGLAVPLGFDNFTLMRALRHRPQSGDGARFTAFVIPHECDTCRKVEGK